MAALAMVSDFGLALVSSTAGSGVVPDPVLPRASRGAEHHPNATCCGDIPTHTGLCSLGCPQKPTLNPSSSSPSPSPLQLPPQIPPPRPNPPWSDTWVPLLALCLEPSSQIKEGDVAPGETEARGRERALGGHMMSLAGVLAEQLRWFWGGFRVVWAAIPSPRPQRVALGWFGYPIPHHEHGVGFRGGLGTLTPTRTTWYRNILGG